MNSARLHYESLDGERGVKKWLPMVALASVIMGVTCGLRFSVASADHTSLYTTSAVRTTPTVGTQTLEWPTHAATRVPMSAAEPEQVVNLEYEPFEQVQSAAHPATRWASLALIPIAAVAGFVLGSRKTSVPSIPQDFEVVIDDGEEDIAMAATTGPKTSLYAVVAIGGHQYVVQPGQILSVDKLPLQTGDEFSFEKVLLLKNGEQVEIGHPYLDSVRVTAEVLRNSKGKKIRIFKYRAKKHYRLTKGHRQKYTDIHITEVAGQKVPSRANLGLPAEQTA